MGERTNIPLAVRMAWAKVRKGIRRAIGQEEGWPPVDSSAGAASAEHGPSVDPSDLIEANRSTNSSLKPFLKSTPRTYKGEYLRLVIGNTPCDLGDPG